MNMCFGKKIVANYDRCKKLRRNGIWMIDVIDEDTEIPSGSLCPDCFAIAMQQIING